MVFLMTLTTAQRLAILVKPMRMAMVLAIFAMTHPGPMRMAIMSMMTWTTAQR